MRLPLMESKLSRISKNPLSIPKLLVVLLLLSGCGNQIVVNSAVTVSVDQPAVRVGSVAHFSATSAGSPVTGGTWTVEGGVSNGTIDAQGNYTAPVALPSSNNVKVDYLLQGQTPYALLTLLNPIPSLTTAAPSTLTTSNSLVTLEGNGFVNSSTILVNGMPSGTNYIDAKHLSTSISMNGFTNGIVTLAVQNPSPGLAMSNTLQVPVSIPLTVSALQSEVRVNGTTSFSASSGGVVVAGGTWSVSGGSANGTIDDNGTFTAPAIVPRPNTIGVVYSIANKTFAGSVSILNPLPLVTSSNPSVLTASGGSVILTGTGFVPSSTAYINGTALGTTFIDQTHLSTLFSLGNASNATSLSVTVSNPAPGASTSNHFSIPVDIAPSDVQISPATLPLGDITLVVSRSGGFPAGATVSINGNAFNVTNISTTSLTVSGFIKPWEVSPVTLAVTGPDGSALLSQSVPLTATPITYDVAARFSNQAAFGPRPDVVEHIQTIGLSAYVDEQLNTSPAFYPLDGCARCTFLNNIVSSTPLLRERVAWAFQSYIPEEEIYIGQTGAPWEITLEADAFTTYKQILLDAASSVGVTGSLNLPGNAAPTDPNQHPNQNFARELMQLFSLGPILLNEDGTPQLDSLGNTIPAYDDTTILDMSRALTGWTLPGPSNDIYSIFGVDWGAPLVAVESQHDQGAKLLFGTVSIPAGQTAAQDRDAVLNAIIQHQNAAPFVSRLLIQRLVKDQPSPQYVARIARVFKDDGTGVKGNLAAVVKAILLDPEARIGDTDPQPDDGFVQDPIFLVATILDVLGLTTIDGEPIYQPGYLGEDYWQPQTVFAYFSPAYMMPGTQLNSPPAQLINTETIVQRSELIYGAVAGSGSGAWFGFNPNPRCWLYTHFSSVASITDALNHLVYHGRMPQYERDAIQSYAATLPDLQSQLRAAVFLALNSDNATVVQ